MEPRRARLGRDCVARHGETVYDLAGRMQGDHPHTPLTRAGFAQADAMGAARRGLLGAKPASTMWAPTAGRTPQALRVVAERLEPDRHAARTDPRSTGIDIGSRSGRYHHHGTGTGGTPT